MNINRIFWILFNRAIFSLKGIKYGSNLRVCNYLPIKMKGNNKMVVGDCFSFYSGENYNPLSRNIRGAIEMEKDAEICIGNNVGISSCCLWIFDKLTIGNNVKIGGDTIILDSDCHSLDFLERRNGNTDRPNAARKEIIIGNDVLIGTRCIVLKGVHIGDRSVIGSGSVVTKDIPSNCIAAGNPCKIFKMTNNE